MNGPWKLKMPLKRSFQSERAMLFSLQLQVISVVLIDSSEECELTIQSINRFEKLMTVRLLTDD